MVATVAAKRVAAIVVAMVVEKEAEKAGTMVDATVAALMVATVESMVGAMPVTATKVEDGVAGATKVVVMDWESKPGSLGSSQSSST